MSEPWFDASTYAWIPGTLLGVSAGLWGGLMGNLAPRGRGKPLILGSLVVLLISAAVLLILGIVALISGQPYGIWYGLILGGAIGVVVLGSVSPMAVMAYRQAEARKMQARDL
jgi:predicted permease